MFDLGWGGVEEFGISILGLCDRELGFLQFQRGRWLDRLIIRALGILQRNCSTLQGCGFARGSNITAPGDRIVGKLRLLHRIFGLFECVASFAHSSGVWVVPFQQVIVNKLGFADRQLCATDIRGRRAILQCRQRFLRGQQRGVGFHQRGGAACFD